MGRGRNGDNGENGKITSWHNNLEALAKRYFEEYCRHPRLRLSFEKENPHFSSLAASPMVPPEIGFFHVLNPRALYADH